MILTKPSNFWEQWLEKWFWFLLVRGFIVNAGALFITILEPDGVLYATIAKTMAQTGDFVNLKVKGNDWLDKPHFPFWIAALSFKLFGATTWAYKLPALLFWTMGAWYTYRFAKGFYGKFVAQLAVLIYVTAAHLVISNNDVRAEPYLTGLIIAGVFHFYKASQEKIGWHLVAGAFFTALAMMTKGPFVLITIGAGFIVHWCLKKEWQQFWNIRWWLALLLIAIFITPELYCLYLQFDQHPEKIVFGRTHVSGIRFFFWDSQFGRFFNTGPIKGSGDPLFYLHTLLWAFIPWSILLYAGFFVCVKQNIASRWRNSSEFITLGAVLITFVIFSLSKFQLPHYLNILFPFFSIITANYLYGVKKNQQAVWWIQHSIIAILLLLLIFVTLFFRFKNEIVILILIVCLSALILILFRHKHLMDVFGRCFGIAVLTYSFVNFIFYPAILQYQSGSKAAFQIKDVYKWNKPVCMLKDYPISYSLEFYLPQTLQFCSLQEVSTKKEILLFVPVKVADSLIKNDQTYQLLSKIPHFHISQLNGKFINHVTRPSILTYFSVLLKN